MPTPPPTSTPLLPSSLTLSLTADFSSGTITSSNANTVTHKRPLHHWQTPPPQATITTRSTLTKTSALSPSHSAPNSHKTVLTSSAAATLHGQKHAIMHISIPHSCKPLVGIAMTASLTLMPSDATPSPQCIARPTDDI